MAEAGPGRRWRPGGEHSEQDGSAGHQRPGKCRRRGWWTVLQRAEGLLAAGRRQGGWQQRVRNRLQAGPAERTVVQGRAVPGPGRRCRRRSGVGRGNGRIGHRHPADTTGPADLDPAGKGGATRRRHGGHGQRARNRGRECGQHQGEQQPAGATTAPAAKAHPCSGTHGASTPTGFSACDCHGRHGRRDPQPAWPWRAPGP